MLIDTDYLIDTPGCYDFNLFENEPTLRFTSSYLRDSDECAPVDDDVKINNEFGIEDEILMLTENKKDVIPPSPMSSSCPTQTLDYIIRPRQYDYNSSLFPHFTVGTNHSVAVRQKDNILCRKCFQLKVLCSPLSCKRLRNQWNQANFQAYGRFVSSCSSMNSQKEEDKTILRSSSQPNKDDVDLQQQPITRSQSKTARGSSSADGTFRVSQAPLPKKKGRKKLSSSISLLPSIRHTKKKKTFPCSSSSSSSSSNGMKVHDSANNGGLCTDCLQVVGLKLDELTDGLSNEIQSLPNFLLQTQYAVILDVFVRKIQSTFQIRKKE